MAVLPEPLAALVLQLLATRRGHAALGDQGTSPWLFPGGQPGRPISAYQLGERLRQLGLQPGQARSTALFQLATDLPAALLARMLGIHITVAVAWQHAAAETAPPTPPKSAAGPSDEAGIRTITSLGALRETKTFPASAADYQALLSWVGTFGVLRRAGVECTGSYGAALARHLRAAGIEVIEVNQPDKATRRRQGKTDSLDAEAAARAVLSGRACGSAKAGDGPVEMLRMFKLAKSSAVKARTQTINQLKVVLIAADPQLRQTLSGLSSLRLIRRCTELDIDAPQDTTSAVAYTLRLLARRILTLTDEIRELEQQITTAVTNHTPHLLTRRGIGPDNAAALLIAAGDNPDRLRSEASLHRPVRRQRPRSILRQNQPSPPQPRR